MCKKNLEEVIWTGLIHVETKLHTSSTKWKVPMLQIPSIILKKWIPHMKYEQQYVYHQNVKEKTK
jgi:hypothetical protein